MTFHELGLHEPLLRAVTGEGYTVPTPIQSQAIPQIVAGRDVLGCAQTGTGKTAAFALPILHRMTAPGNPRPGSGRRIRTLVLSPTRELAVQILESFQTYGRHTPLRYVAIFGGVGQQPQVKALKNGVDVVIATPGRLMDLINQGYVELRSVETFVLDEADRMLDMGFLPDLRRVVARLPSARQTLFFSATMPPTIEQLANSILTDPVRIRIAPVQITTDLIDESVCHLSGADKPKVLTELLDSDSIKRAIVFTRTKRGADRVAKQLNRDGIRAEAIHGNKAQGARQRILASFKSPRPPILVATDLAARGIDVEGVSHVFNYDLPYEPEGYVHRIGRTGRAGAKGTAIAFCTAEDRPLLRAIETLTRRRLTVDKEHSTTVPAEPVRHVKTNGNQQANSRPKAKQFGRKGPHSASRQTQLDNANAAGVSTNRRDAAGQGRGKPHRRQKQQRQKTQQRTPIVVV